MIRFFILMTALLVYAGAPVTQVRAQDSNAVQVRTGVHPDYARIVFDGRTRSLSYDFSRPSDRSLSLVLSGVSSLDMSAAGLSGLPAVRAIETRGEGENGLTVDIEVDAGSQVRHFTIGNRVIVDVMNGAGSESTAQAGGDDNGQEPAQPAPATAEEEEESPSPSSLATDTRGVPIEMVDGERAMPPAEELQAEFESGYQGRGSENRGNRENGNLLEAVMGGEPHVVTLSFTEPVGLAVFERGESLWIVMDRSDVKVRPELAGPNADLFPAFRRYELRGGIAFRMNLPPSMNFFVYGEGGGLVWRVVLSPDLRRLEAATPTHSFTRNQNVRGGTALWPLSMMTKILDVYDPTVGDTLKVVTVEQSDQLAGASRSYVDFESLPSVVGLALAPKSDDVNVTLTPQGVEVSRPGGLALSRDRDVGLSLMRKGGNHDLSARPDPSGRDRMQRIFDFDRWLMGGKRALGDNQQIMLTALAEKDDKGRAHDLLSLAKMNLANGRAVEALAFMNIATDLIPELERGAEFIALRGAARTLAGQSDLAFNDLMNPVLGGFGELAYWRSYMLADLEDWQQAIRNLPEDMSVLYQYPVPILQKLGPKLAEAALRGGDIVTAEEILEVMRLDEDKMPPWTLAAVKYLEGVTARERDNLPEARRKWEELSRSYDDFYRARSGLALTMLDKDHGTITNEEAINRLEGLRYLWRGDEFEAQVNFMLGRLYIDEGEYLKGLAILRDAATMSPNSDIGREIASYMSDSFNRILREDDKLSALDAVTIYDEFRELTPADDEGNLLIQRLAERLVDADLLGRAARILRHQVDYRLQNNSDERARVALRLATIYLLGNNPEEALTALDEAEAVYSRRNSAESAARMRDIRLLRARAFSDAGQPQKALDRLAALPPSVDISRLRADIAWQAGAWREAAEALDDLIFDLDIASVQSLTQEQADIILNRAVALNLAGDRVALSNIRQRYGNLMKDTERARLFDVVTRERKDSMLADRDTLLGLINEVDIFREFLDGYRDLTSVSN